MKKYISVFVFFIFTGIAGIGQTTTFQGACELDSTINLGAFEDFAKEIALNHMKEFNHPYYDSIIIPASFLDSIKAFLSIYQNTIELSGSIIDFSDFNPGSDGFAELVFIVDTSYHCITSNNGTFQISNDTLTRLIDSLGLEIGFINLNSFSVLNSNAYNLHGNFDFFYDIPCIRGIEPIFEVASYLPCYKRRSAVLHDGYLEISLVDMDYCISNTYLHRWSYRVTMDCSVEILEIPVSIKQNPYHGQEKLSFVYLNPFNNELHVKSHQNINEISFYSLDGALQKHVKFNNNPVNTINLKRKQVYLVKINFSNGLTEYHKVVKD